RGSTPFPSTTLFRSVADADAIVGRRALVPAGQVIEAWNDLYTPGHFWLGEESKRLLDAAGEPVPPVITLPAEPEVAGRVEIVPGDRKSTRLNSSHVA